ncbi:universal stress protein [Rhodoferax sp. PAMC 29310]|uniref:universal stress protein n=1 Tax=Rhodoferax sp. PAMC 29310 TaxID=2822760 RepID=UPI001B31A268|nr:universal stress protein [Rhodoferax sp. PAMC 29310]
MKILLPIDGSDVSLEAVRVMIRLSKDGLATSAVLANVQEAATLYELVVAHDPAVIEQVSAAAGAHTLQPGEALLNEAGIAYETEVASGDPAHTIIDILERYGCDMVIMGARGMSTLRGALLGSVSNEVLHTAKVPVMIVKLVDASSEDSAIDG